MFVIFHFIYSYSSHFFLSFDHAHHLKAVEELYSLRKSILIPFPFQLSLFFSFLACYSRQGFESQ